MNRWWVYQKERFPLVAHGPLIAAFSASAVCYSAYLRNPGEWPHPVSFAVAFLVSLGSFLLLRIADEHKDSEEDARWRPYRAVPRGLVTLGELRAVGVAVAAMQLLLALMIGPGVIGLLAVTWVYFVLMSKEFFVRDWLKRRPVVYLFSHMFIMPLVDWFATGCDWVRVGEGMPTGLFWFLAASFCNGVVIELGRKIRSPEQEEAGVETYSFIWGRSIAVASWWAALAATTGCALMAARNVGHSVELAWILGVLLVGAVVLGVCFLKTLNGKLAKGIEAASGVWTLALYLGLGVLPQLLVCRLEVSG